MIQLQFNIDIKAPKEKVWNVLWNDQTYRQWTTPFCEGSYAKSDWEEGSAIQFLSPGNNGIYSRIHKKEPPTEMTFQHLGEIRNGEEIRMDWPGAFERYHLETTDDRTRLKVEVSITDAFKEYMTDTFPKALAVVKQLAENG